MPKSMEAQANSAKLNALRDIDSESRLTFSTLFHLLLDFLSYLDKVLFHIRLF